MKRFFLITNEAKDPAGAFTKKITDIIERHGGEAVCVKNERHALAESGMAGVDCALVLGGDGTLLRAAGNMMDSDIPLLGINLGTLGYLAEVESACAEEAVIKLLRDEYVREERMMLSGRVMAGQEEERYALNDIVISRCGSLQILNVRIYVNDRFLNDYCADGVIVATPTGSTGYNLSAGGPIVEPSARLLLLTPICPHTLNTRSIVFSPEDEITVEIPAGKDGHEQVVEASFDGSNTVTLRTGDRVRIRRSDKTTGIVRLNTESFLTVLHKKMSEVI
ncbi:MAG: NAD(+)/NADH kinase [Lachnospiraceae bacterium]|nr:NAD(+)/NADH kinase [Lachnospiraceae bacterium]